MPTDSAKQRELAMQQRDQGLLDPGDPNYDAKLQELWGGPAPNWFAAAMETWPKTGKGQTALVTGGSGGIGFYVSKLLAAVGFTVVVPSRPGMEAEAEAAVKAITLTVPDAHVVVPATPLDLGNLESVRAFTAALCGGNLEQIDVLCLNAGRGGGKDDPRETTVDGLEAIMQVNAVGHFLLTEGLMPLLKASASARIVSQTSGARFFAKLQKVGDLNGTDSSEFSAFDQYCLSKAANVLFTKSLNEQLEASGIGNIIACVADPGLSSTGVNIQHDLTNSLGMRDISTNQMHDSQGHHAADGALPMVLASLVGTNPTRNQWYTTDGRKATSLPEAAHAQGGGVASPCAFTGLDSYNHLLSSDTLCTWILPRPQPEWGQRKAE
jgi:NAD(P)-dependent dehydrogenase (short-subunit alcohol dehydrogenase family)